MGLVSTTNSFSMGWCSLIWVTVSLTTEELTWTVLNLCVELLVALQAASKGGYSYQHGFVSELYTWGMLTDEV